MELLGFCKDAGKVRTLSTQNKERRGYLRSGHLSINKKCLQLRYCLFSSAGNGF